MATLKAVGNYVQNFAVLIALGRASLGYIAFFNGKVTLGFSENWGTQNIYGFVYPALLALLFLSMLGPMKRGSVLLGKIGVLGKASYHIFLFQILFFGFDLGYFFVLNPELNPAWTIFANVVVCCGVGVPFYYSELTLVSKLNSKGKTK